MFWVMVYNYEKTTDEGRGEPVRRIGPFSTRKLAEKADDGLTRQLNHSRFYSVVEEERRVR